MRASPNSSNGDKTRRASRTAPRRHVDPQDKTVAPTYDSGEFPVLLRMSDLKQELETGLHDSPEAPVTDSLPVESESPEVPTRRQTRSKHQHPLSEKRATTANASSRFWGTLAPKLAIGGMLLSVTALCVVVLQGPPQSKLEDADQSQWAVDPVSASTSHDEPTPAKSVGEQHHSVAAKPEVSRATAPVLNNPVSRDIGPIGSQPSSAVSDMGTGWPGEAGKTADSSNSAQVSSPSFQAQGWPDDVEAGDVLAPTESQLQLNAAMKSAQRQFPTRSQTSARKSRPVAPNQPDSPAGARLNGTVELPNPRADYQR